MFSRFRGVLTASMGGICLATSVMGAALADEFNAPPAPDDAIGARTAGGTGFGFWRPASMEFFVDLNGNGRWDGVAGGDTISGPFGRTIDTPVVGDWNGDGVDEVGFYHPTNGRFYQDMNGNRTWDGRVGGDTISGPFGMDADIPVAGDWDGDGDDDIGVYDPVSNKFLLDMNGNRRWDGVSGGDTITARFGLATDTPVVGDWDGDGADDVGFWRPGNRRFYLDANGNDRWDRVAGGDTITGRFGLATDTPVVGDWNGDDVDDLGFRRPGTGKFYLDINTNGQWDRPSGGDGSTLRFGRPTDVPIVGRWTKP